MNFDFTDLTEVSKPNENKAAYTQYIPPSKYYP